MDEADHIFISYSHLDADFARKLADDLKTADVPIWIDENIQGGQKWRPELGKAIEACGAMIAIVSPKSIGSKQCNREWDMADDLDRRIIPLLLHEIETRPFVLIGIQYIDFTDWNDKEVYNQKFEELLAALKHATSEHRFAGEGEYLNNLINDLKDQIGVSDDYVNLAGTTDVLSDTHLPVNKRRWERYFSVSEPSQHHSRRTSLHLEKRLLKSIGEAVATWPYVSLLGAPGSGKTTTLRNLVLSAARKRKEEPKAHPLPLLLSLSEWDNSQTFNDFIQEKWPLRSDLTSFLSKSGVALYLDGLDEMGVNTKKNVEELRQWLQNNRAYEQVVITCREDEYDSHLDLNLPTIRIEPLNEEQIEKFVENYLPDTAELFLAQVLPPDKEVRLTRRSLFHLANNPCLLAGLINIYQISPERNLPRNIGQLFENLVEILWNRERFHNTPGWISLEEMQGALARLAFEMVSHDRAATSIERTLDLLTGYWRFGGRKKSKGLFYAAQKANLLEVQDGQVRFYHQMMQEYFAAVWLARKRRKLDNFVYISWRWHNVITALCSIAPKTADEVITEIAIKRPRIAAACLLEGVEVSERTWVKVIKQLIERLQSDDPEVQWATVGALREVADTSVVPQLLQLFETRKALSLGIIWILGGIGDSLTILALLNMPTKNSHYLGAIVNSIWEIGNRDDHTVEVLMDALDNSDEQIRSLAAISLGVLQKVSATNKLIGILNEHSSNEAYLEVGYEHFYARHAAAWALGMIGITEATSHLLSLPDESFQEVKYWALGKIWSPHTGELIRSLVSAKIETRLFNIRLLVSIMISPRAAILAFEDCSPPELYWLKEGWPRQEAIKNRPSVNRFLESSVKKYWDWNYWDLSSIGLAETMKDGSPVYEKVVQSIESLEAETISQLLILQHDNAADLRVLAGWVLGIRRDADAVPKLIEDLHYEKSPFLREIITQSLSRIGNPATWQLMNASKSEDEEVRKAAAYTLAGIFDPNAVPSLLEVLRVGDIDMRCAAALALAKIKDPIAIPKLIECLYDTSEPQHFWMSRTVSLCAEVALGAIGTQEARMGIEKWREYRSTKNG